MNAKPRGDEAVTRRVELKGFRIDLVIAVCALFVSSLATAASVWQSRVVAQQLASQVWPYVSLQSSYDGKSVSAIISNEGLGPARIRSVVLTVDGAPHRYLAEALSMLMPGQKPALHGTFTDVEPGAVIRVGGSVTLFHITDRPIINALINNFSRVGLRVCYCPIIPGNCWIVRKQGPVLGTVDPEVVAECPDESHNTLSSGVVLKP